MMFEIIADEILMIILMTVMLLIFHRKVFGVDIETGIELQIKRPGKDKGKMENVIEMLKSLYFLTVGKLLFGRIGRLAFGRTMC